MIRVDPGSSSLDCVACQKISFDTPVQFNCFRTTRSTTMWTQTALFATLLCLNLLAHVSATGIEMPVITSKQPNPVASGVSTTPDKPSVTDLTDFQAEELTTYSALGLEVPKIEAPNDNNEALFGLEYVPSNQEEYEELPRTCWDCLCGQRRRVPKHKNPRLTVTPDPIRRTSHSTSWLSRNISASTAGERGEAGEAGLQRSTSIFGGFKDLTFFKRHRSSSIDKQGKEVPSTNRPASGLEPRIPRNMTQQEPDGVYHAPSLDNSIEPSSQQQDVSGVRPETSASATNTRPGSPEQDQV